MEANQGKRTVRDVVYLIDIDEEMPNPGELVLALGIGGKLVETVWNKNSHKFFKAFMYYPRVPKVVKDKLYQLYLNGGGAA